MFREPTAATDGREMPRRLASIFGRGEPRGPTTTSALWPLAVCGSSRAIGPFDVGCRASQPLHLNIWSSSVAVIGIPAVLEPAHLVSLVDSVRGCSPPSSFVSTPDVLERERREKRTRAKQNSHLHLTDLFLPLDDVHIVPGSRNPDRRF
jgi:hypothetical protein